MSADQHLVQFSTGLASAEVAWRLVERHGPKAVHLLTADTRAEDADNWRFAHQVADTLGCGWTILSDGRTPMQVGRDRKVVPNNRMAVCSRILKRELLRAHIDQAYDPASTVIQLGYDWTEPHRLAAAIPQWEPYRVEAILADPPLVMKEQLLQIFRARGIEPPRLYAQGFAHANCGGACVRGGLGQWSRLLAVNPERYRDWESEEEETRSVLGKDVAILRDRTGGTVRPMTLAEFRHRIEDQPTQAGLFDADDTGACGCFSAEDAS